LEQAYRIGISSEESLERHKKDQLSTLPGIIANNQTLRSLCDCYDEVAEFYDARIEGSHVIRINSAKFLPLQIADFCREEISTLLELRR
jgi:hypothetical protein